MTFDLHLHIESGSPESTAVETVAHKEHISLEEAVRTILRRAGEAEREHSGSGLSVGQRLRRIGFVSGGAADLAERAEEYLSLTGFGEERNEREPAP